MYRRFWTNCELLVLLVTASVTLTAAERPSIFEEANTLYEQGNYSEAASRYESLLKVGRVSPAVFFNLGNAHFKQGQIGLAILNYRRAEMLAPRDPDIQANLRFTRDRVPGNLSVRAAAWQRLLNYFTVNELATATAVLLWLWAALFCATRLRPALGISLRTISGLTELALGVVVLFLIATAIAKRDQTAVVIVKQATIHLGPLAESQAAFTANDGVELRVLDTRPDWAQVTDRSGKTGWISLNEAALVGR